MNHPGTTLIPAFRLAAHIRHGFPNDLVGEEMAGVKHGRLLCEIAIAQNLFCIVGGVNSTEVLHSLTRGQLCRE